MKALYIFASAPLLVIAVLLAACSPRKSVEETKPAPSAAVSRDLALVWARRVASDVGGTVVTFTPTGSMLPLIDSRSVGAAEHLLGNEPLHVGDIVLFERGDGFVCHRVVEVHPSGAALISGDNTRSDGWIARERIRFRLVAVFYTLR